MVLSPELTDLKGTEFLNNLETSSNVCKNLEYDKGDTSNQWEKILT